MTRLSKKEASGQVRKAKVAWVNDLRDAPRVNYAFELKLATKAPEMTKRYYVGEVRKAVKDERGNLVRYTPPCADISDLGLLEVMGSVGFEEQNGYLLLDVYEDRDGRVYVEGGEIEAFAGVKEAFDRAKNNWMKANM